MAWILIIDDDEMVRVSLEMMLQTAGWQTQGADGGADGLAKARQRRPDLIFCDLNMHGMNGLQILAVLREDPALQTVPVLMMTGSEGEEAERQALQLGARAIVLKPFHHRELVRLVEGFLTQAEDAS
jgi:CheY-like chemotaxis protein